MLLIVWLVTELPKAKIPVVMPNDRILVVSLQGALTRLENFQHEMFDADQFDIVGLSVNEFRAHEKNWTHHKKIAVVSFVFYAYPDVDLSLFDMILLIDEEAINENSGAYLDQLGEKFQNHNIIAVTSGYHMGHKLDTDRIYIFPFFFFGIQRHNHIGDLPEPSTSVGWNLDALLGMNKPHRMYVFRQLAANDLLPRSLVNLTTNQHSNGKVRTIYRSPELDDLEPQGVMESLPDSHLNSYLYVNNGPRISHLMPWKMYQHTSFSVVAETNWEHYVFFSEKTAKCLLGHRAFVFFGSHGQLDLLRHWGFMTLDDVIDESYDDIVDNEQRFSRAFDQVLALNSMPHRDLDMATKRARDHNRSHIQNGHYWFDPLRHWLMQQIHTRCG